MYSMDLFALLMPAALLLPTLFLFVFAGGGLDWGLGLVLVVSTSSAVLSSSSSSLEWRSHRVMPSLPKFELHMEQIGKPQTLSFCLIFSKEKPPTSTQARQWWFVQNSLQQLLRATPKVPLLWTDICPAYEKSKYKVSCQKNEKKIQITNLTFFCTTGIFIQQYSIRFEKARAGDDSVTCPLLLWCYSAMNALLYSVAWQTEANSIMEACHIPLHGNCFYSLMFHQAGDDSGRVWKN